MRTKVYDYIIGAVLIAVSLFMLFKNTYISSWGFHRIGGMNTGAILFILLIVSIMAYVASPSREKMYLIIGILALIVLSLVSGIHFVLRYMSLLDALLIFVPLAAGIGLLLPALFRNR